MARLEKKMENHPAECAAMDDVIEKRFDGPPSKKCKLDNRILGLTEADKFHAVPSGDLSDFHPYHDASYKNQKGEGSHFGEDFQVVDEFADDEEQLGECSLLSPRDEDGRDDILRSEDYEDDDDDEDDMDSLGSEIDALLDEGLPEMYNKEPKRKRGGGLLETEAGASREVEEALPDGVVGVRTKTILKSK